MIRKKNKYSRPKKLYEISRIKEENELLKKYALKNKREIWKTIAKVNYFRKRAMALAKSPLEEQEVLFNKLRNLGLKINSIADILALKVNDLLERRLPTIVFKKNFANTIKQARQMVVHKNVLVNGRVINIPSYLVSISEENSISLKKPIKKSKTEEKIEKEQTEKLGETKQ
ncbi:MAG: 30S ribosomal protein S4 [Candidatus Pacearchaeota archaeon]|nr:30S ribosomal protein S4 [Candidatus Pacearchaeota archaeon]